jgi:TRAP-type mannitol/chloroaromatic compound transport system substrate-binding protein
MHQISRKRFLRNLVIGGTAATFLGCKGNENKTSDGVPNINTNKKFRWNMVTTWPPNFPVLGEGCNLFANWVNEMSGGQLTIKVYGGGELIPALEVFDAVSSGTAEIGSGASYYWAGKSTAAQFFASFPFGFNAQQMNAWLYSGGGQKLWEEVYTPFNVQPLPGGNTGVQMAGWFNRDVSTIEDLRGLKMRIPGLGGKVLKEAGGTVVLSPGGEIYTNLERGVIDAAEWIGPYHDYNMGFHQIAKNYYYPGWHEPGSTLEIIMNKRKFENLPANLQAILTSASARLNIWMLSEFEAKNAEYLKIIQDEGKVNISPLPQPVLDNLKILTLQIIEDMVAKDPMSKKIYDSIKIFKSRMSAWSKLTEEAYYQNM